MVQQEIYHQQCIMDTINVRMNKRAYNFLDETIIRERRRGCIEENKTKFWIS